MSKSLNQAVPLVNIEKLYDKVSDWILYYGPRLVIAILVFLLGQWLIHIARKRLMSHVDKRDVSSALRPFFRSLIFTALQILLLLLIMQILGIQLTIFAALIAAFGAAAGLALSGTLQNFASGVLILMLKPFEIGDNIFAQGQEGTVTSIQLFFTIINTADNRVVVVPNSKLSNEIIINISGEGKRRMDIELKFDYSVEFETIKGIIVDTIFASTDVLVDPAPRIGISHLEADGYKVMINAWVNARGFYNARLITNERILNAIKNAGIKLPGMQPK